MHIERHAVPKDIASKSPSRHAILTGSLAQGLKVREVVIDGGHATYRAGVWRDRGHDVAIMDVRWPSSAANPGAAPHLNAGGIGGARFVVKGDAFAGGVQIYGPFFDGRHSADFDAWHGRGRGLTTFRCAVTRVLRLTLTTRTGRTGIQFLKGADMSWTSDDDDETCSAVFELFDSGALIETATLDGDEWRALEGAGSVDEWLCRVEVGASLAAVLGVALAKDCAT